MIVMMVMGMAKINPFSAGTVFIRLNLTYKNVPRTERIKIFIMAYTHNICIQMNRDKLTK